MSQYKDNNKQVQPTQFSYEDYQIPQWSGIPTKQYYLEVIKEGTLLEKVHIDKKAFYLVGKVPDICDIVLDNPTISRKHAIIQHKNDGTLHIYDLGSTHGTRVNKRLIEKAQFIKLKVGDHIKFGGSSRYYVLCLDGEEENEPEELESMELIRKKLAEKDRKEQKETLKEKYERILTEQAGYEKKTFTKQNYVGIEWGMVDDAEVYFYGQSTEMPMEPDLLRQLPDLTIKQIEKIQDFEKKLNKLRGLEKEYGELVKKEKEEFGLAEELVKRKQALEIRLNEQSSQVQIAEDNLKFFLFNEQKHAKKLLKLADEDTFGDDEFYDRTLTKKVKLNEETQVVETPIESFHSLKTKLEDLLDEQKQLNLSLLNLNEETLIQNQNEEVDELDKFMQQNQASIQSIDRKSIIEKLKTINDEITRTSNMLKFVKPDYQINTQQLIENREKEQQRRQQASEYYNKKQDNTKKQIELIKQKVQERKKENEQKQTEENTNIQEDIEQFQDQEEQQEVDDQQQQENEQNQKMYTVRKPLPRNVREKDIELEEDIEEWRELRGQSGSGYTHLNQKYGY